MRKADKTHSGISQIPNHKKNVGWDREGISGKNIEQIVEETPAEFSRMINFSKTYNRVFRKKKTTWGNRSKYPRYSWSWKTSEENLENSKKKSKEFQRKFSSKLLKFHLKLRISNGSTL